MSAKRNPQTAAKRAREQAMREKRERKAEKKRAVIEARNAPDAPSSPEEGDVVVADAESA
jgi:hypothetical protein